MKTSTIRGMTMVEMLIYITLFTLVMLTVTASVQFFYRSNRYTVQQASAVTSAQHGVDKVVRTIREATFASDGAYPVVSLADNQFSFYADVDSDPFVEKVRYYLNGDTIVEGIVDATGDPPTYTGVETTSIVSDYVRNTAENLIMFTYFDEEGAQITNYADIADVRFVTLNIVVDVDTGATPPAVTLRSSAALRNLK